MSGLRQTGLLIDNPTLFGVEYSWRCADCGRCTPVSFDRNNVLLNARIHRRDHHDGTLT